MAEWVGFVVVAGTFAMLGLIDAATAAVARRRADDWRLLAERYASCAESKSVTDAGFGGYARDRAAECARTARALEAFADAWPWQRTFSRSPADVDAFVDAWDPKSGHTA